MYTAIRYFTIFLLIITASLHAEEQSVLTLGKAKFNALLQTWVVSDDTVTTTTPLNFRLRRAEIKLSGSVIERTRWFVMIDPAKSLKLSTSGTLNSANDNKILQDLGVGFSLFESLEVVAGQFKTPRVAEGLDSSAELLLPERSLVARTYGDKREPGIMLVLTRPSWKISGMVSNGQNTNVDDVNSSKHFSLRADIDVLEGLRFGIFTGGTDFSYLRQGTWGANIKLSVQSFVVKLEGVYQSSKNPDLKSYGYVGLLGYSILPQLQPVILFEVFKADTTSSSNSKAVTFGLNYYVSNHNAKIQGAATRLFNMAAASGGTYTAGTTDGTLVTIVFQAAI